MEIIGDIGGTKSLFHIFVRKEKLEKSYLNSDFKSLYDMIDDLLEYHGLRKDLIDCKMTFAIAAPILSDEVMMTNLDWSISKKELTKKTNCQKIYFINDLKAVAYYVSKSSFLKYLPVKSGSFKRTNNTFLVIGLGTGFGMGVGHDINDTGDYTQIDKTIPIDINREYNIIESEGGHAAFSPISSLELSLFTHLQEKLGRVSIEDVCSSRGLYNIYQFMTRENTDIESKDHYRQLHRYKNPVREIIKHSKGRVKCDICQYVVKNMVEILAHKLSDLSLEFLPYQGIFLFGGLVSNILSYLMAEEFVKIYKGRDIKFEDDLKNVDPNYIDNMKIIFNKIPIYVITEESAAILGAKSYSDNL